MFDAHKLGYIRAGAAVPRVHVANPEANAREILALVEEAEKLKLKVLAFPELCLCGYTCADLFHQRLLLQKTEEALAEILKKTGGTDTVIVVGLPVACDNRLFNCAAVLHSGRILGVVPKSHVPNYNEFYEKRWFSPASARRSATVILCGAEIPFGNDLIFDADNSLLTLAAEICEDLWMPVPPSSHHALAGATLIVNPSASNDLVGKPEYRRDLVRQQSARCLAGYVYVSAGPGESTTDVVFGGHTMVCENGYMLAERRYEEGCITFADIDLERMHNERRKANSFMDDTESPFRRVKFTFCSPEAPTVPGGLHRFVDASPFVPGDREDRDTRCREIFRIQTEGLARRLQKTGIRRALLSISGGLDSTLALLVCREAFKLLGRPASDILCITMPGFGTTERTRNNAHDLMRELGAEVREIPITEACLVHFRDIGHDPAVHDISYENTQARERMQIMMDVANRENGLVVGTGDLSELALGWCTYNGDHMSHYGVNAGVPKTLVKYLVRWYADTAENPAVRDVLLDILDTPISPELLPPDAQGNIRQKTEDVVGSYDLHDFFLYHMLRWGCTPEKIYFLAQSAFAERFSPAEIKKWLRIFCRRFFTQQFKRSCLPDGPKVGSICLSPRGDWRMPSDASAETWITEADKLPEE